MASNAETVLERLLREASSDPAAHRSSGALHTSGEFMHLVRDTSTGEFLAPTYHGLEEVLIAGHRRAKAAEAAGSPLRDFRPYPTPFGYGARRYRTNRIAIIDSGVLADHPLISTAIVAVHDVTGEGIDDQSGHGTIQAIRHHWVEPRARLVIVKAFAGLPPQPSVWTLLEALDYIGTADVDYVFIAGGIDQAADAAACRVCEAADDLAERCGLKFGGFVATKGNVGDTGHWCPAEAEHVEGVVVLDADSFAPGYGPTGGLGVLQKGPYASFPAIASMRLGEFFLQSSRYSRAAGVAQLAREYADLALEQPDYRVEALRHRALIDLDDGRASVAAERLWAAVESAPGDGDARADLGAVLILLGDKEEGRRQCEQALAVGGDNAMLHHNLAKLLEREDFDAALEHYRLAARANSYMIAALVGVGWDAFYSGRHSDALKVAETIMVLDPTLAVGRLHIAGCHSLLEEHSAAAAAIETYAGALEALDSSAISPPAPRFRELLGEDEVTRRAIFPWARDDDRRYAREYATFAGIAELSLQDATHRLAALDDEELAAVCSAALSLVERLLMRPASTQHQRCIATLELLADRLGPTPTPASAAVWRALGALRHRCGAFPTAAQAATRAADLWHPLNQGAREESIAAAAYAYFASGDIPGAARVLSADGIPIFVTATGWRTRSTPRLRNAELELAIRERRVPDYPNLLGAAYDGRGYRPETLLQHARILIAQGFPKDADRLIIDAIQSSVQSPGSCNQFALFLADHPINDVLGQLGSVTERLVLARSDAIAREVTLVAAAAPTRQPDAAPLHLHSRGGPTLHIAVLGTGLDPMHPALLGRIRRSVDLTGEGSGDRQGSGTRRALTMLKHLDASANAEAMFLDVKVLDSTGRGSVDAFLRGLVWAEAAGADWLATDVQIDRPDNHREGLLRRGADAMHIAGSLPDPGHGACFPGLVSDRFREVPLE